MAFKLGSNDDWLIEWGGAACIKINVKNSDEISMVLTQFY